MLPTLLFRNRAVSWLSLSLLLMATFSASAQSQTLTQTEFDTLYGSLPPTEIIGKVGAGDSYAIIELANRFAAGSGGIPQNNSEAARLFSLSLQRSYPGGPRLSDISQYPIRPTRPNASGTIAPSPPTDPLPTPELVVSVSEAATPFTTTISIASDWPGNATLFSWDLNLDDEDATVFDSMSLESALDQPTVTATYNAAGEYAVRVIVMDQYGRMATGHTTIVATDNIVLPPQTPVPVFPTQDALLIANSSIEFQWQATDFADSYDFHFFDGVTPLTLPFLIGFNAADVCEQDVCSLSLPIELPLGGSHAWRVRAVNSANQRSAWSRTRFSVIEPITQAPSDPLLATPENAMVIENLTDVTFGWLPSTDAQQYTFVLTNALGDVVVERDFSASSCSDSACTFSELINLPTFETYQWQVSASNTIGESASAIRTLSVIPPATAAPTQPTNISPAVGAQFTEGELVAFSWSHEDDTAFYEFHFFNQTNGDLTFINDIDPQQVCSDDTCSIEAMIDLPVAPLHAWRVRGKNSLGTTAWTRSTFSVVPAVDEPPNTPTAITPLANTQIETGSSVTFTWSKAALANSYSFELIRGSDVLANTVSQSACGGSTCSVNLPILDGAGIDHSWRVQALNTNGTSDWVTTDFVVIDAPTEPPAAVTTFSPVESDVLVRGASIPIVWGRIANASSYDLMLDDVAANDSTLLRGLNPLDICVAEVCTHALVLDVATGDEQAVRVRAVNSLGESAWDRTTFAVIDSGAPAAPTLIAPADGTFLTNATSVELVWSAVNNASVYDLDIGEQVFNALAATSVCLTETGDAANDCRYTVDLPTSEPTEDGDSSTEEFTWRVRATTPAGTSDYGVAAFSLVSDTSGTAPIAAFTLSNFTADILGAAPLTVVADPSASSDDVGIVRYEWSFGDGSEPVVNTSAATVSHTYTDAGTYTMSLTVIDAADESHTTTRTITVIDPANTLTDVEASRFLAQASFGATEADILHVRALGIEAWIDQQFSMQGDAHLDYVNVHSNGSNRWPRHEVWWRDVVEGEDQLRQRVAFALSELFVVSDIGYTLANSQYGVTNFYDQLRDHAFGNYRDLLETVTLSPVMGLYLSMLQNAKGDEAASTRPDENYAREVLQLFSIGVDELNLDGSPTGQPGYTQENIEEFARVFTGWNYKDAGRWDRGLSTGQDLISPMEPFEEFHDTGSKTLLQGVEVPGGLSAAEDMQRALDNIAAHPNVGPFVAMHLIQRLTTSNPTPAYVARVATVFNDNGDGVRGDLQAVVKAVLLDNEARTDNRPSHYGKLREPILRISHLWRAFSVSPGANSSNRGEYNTSSPSLENLDLATGQAVLKSTSVFNFFKPEFAAIGPVSSNNLVSPEFEIMTESNEIATTNRIGEQINRFFAGAGDSFSTSVSFLNFDKEFELAAEPESLLDHLDTLLMAGSMSATFRSALLEHINTLPDTASGHSERVRDAVTLIMASPDYLIQQ